MRSHPGITFLATFLLIAIPITALACLWDYDTLRMERTRFPNTLELITGKFLRHSKEFYAWRIQDRLQKIDKEPNRLESYDDLAVAFEKTGQHDLAIDWILKKEKIKPGLYETYSNLGTFHILAGDLELGLPWIDKALAINPDAHFGRERYQKWLVEYALTRKKDGRLSFPLRRENPDKNLAGDFKVFLLRQLGTNTLSVEENRKAVQSILGMMRFANHDNPLLLEALGDLLFETYGEGARDAKQLAAFAYLKASNGFADSETKKAFHQLAQTALKMQTAGPRDSSQMPMESLEKEFHTMEADADAWYAQLKEKEIGWIRDGKNVDDEFDRLYTEEPSVNEATQALMVPTARSFGKFAILVLVLVGVLLLVFLGNGKRA